MKKDNKKAFSLIEIMQTVILLGIIAGLSISFFRRIDTDSKLEQSTVPIIKKAIDQTIKDVCNSSIPICKDSAAPVCPSGYNHNAVTDTCVSIKLACTKTLTTDCADCTLGFINSSGYCETPMLCSCPSGYSWFNTGSTVICGRIVDEATTCDLYCNGSTVDKEVKRSRTDADNNTIYTCDCKMPLANESKPTLQQNACDSGTVNLFYQGRYGNQTELCIGLVKYLNSNNNGATEKALTDQMCGLQGQRLSLGNGVVLVNLAEAATKGVIYVDVDRDDSTGKWVTATQKVDKSIGVKCLQVNSQGIVPDAQGLATLTACPE